MGKLREFFKGLKKNNKGVEQATEAEPPKQEKLYNFDNVYFLEARKYNYDGLYQGVTIVPYYVDKNWKMTRLTTEWDPSFPDEITELSQQMIADNISYENTDYLDRSDLIHDALEKILKNKSNSFDSLLQPFYGTIPEVSSSTELVSAIMTYSGDPNFDYRRESSDPYNLLTKYPDFLKRIDKFDIIHKHVLKTRLPLSAILNQVKTASRILTHMGYSYELDEAKKILKESKALYKQTIALVSAKPKQNKQADELISDILATPQVKPQQKPQQAPAPQQPSAPRSKDDILNEFKSMDPQKIVSDIRNGKQPQHAVPRTYNNNNEIAK